MELVGPKIPSGLEQKEDTVSYELISSKKSDILLEDNHIFNNNRSGVRVRGSSSVFISRCKVFNNGRSGLRLERYANVTVDQSDIFLNSTAGIDVMNSRKVVCVGSNIFQNRAVGIRIKTKGKRYPKRGLFQFYKSRSYLNSQSGILAVPAEDSSLAVEILYSDIFENGRAGVRVKGNTFLRAKRATIHSNGEAGLAFFSSGDVLPFMDVYESKIFFNGRAGILVHGGITGPIGIVNNWIYNNYGSGIVSGIDEGPDSTYSVLKIYHNTIVANGSGTQGAGIRNDSSGWVDIENNILAYNFRPGIVTSHCEDASHNLLFDNGQAPGYDPGKPHSFLLKRLQYGGCPTGGEGDILADPRFSAPERFDFSLFPSSPARNAAVLLPGSYFKQFGSRDLGSLLVPPGNPVGGPK